MVIYIMKFFDELLKIKMETVNKILLLKTKINFMCKFSCCN